MKTAKNIALVAHDNRKQDLVDWVSYNHGVLENRYLICTGTTGIMVRKALDKKIKNKNLFNSINISMLKSGPLGGDQQLGSLITEGKIDILIFFWDPMASHPHEVDVKALLRIAVVYNIPVACNRSSADFIISSPLVESPYAPTKTDFSSYENRTMHNCTV